MAGQAFAQDASSQVGEVVVTGSRIAITNVDSPSPVSVVSAEDISKTNAFSIGDVLQRLAGPDYTGGISGASNNGGVGLSEVGLRNLGPPRTLILIDGQRLVPVFTATATVPDLNSVPIGMIDRIEVLRDGASSIYGADAIGGVINIITKTNFSGFQVDASGGVDEHGGGGGNYSLSATGGMNSEKGNLTVSLVHEERDPVLASSRDWAVDPKIGTAFEGGSAYRSQLNILQDEGSSTVWNNGVETNYHNSALGALPCLTFLPGLNRVKLNANCGAIADPATLTSGLSRNQISFSGRYNLTDHLRFVSSGFFTDRHSEQRLRPEPLLGDSIASTYPQTGAPVYGGFQIPELASFHFTDPNNTVSGVPCAGNAAVTCFNAYLTPNEFNSRDYQQTSETYRIRAGFEGDVMGFKWEAGYVAQRNDTTDRIGHSGNFLHLAEATAQAPCVDVPGGCTFNPLFGYATPTTPFNFFNGVGTLTPAQVNYLTFTMTDTNYNSEDYAYADVNGTLFNLPAGPVQASLGVERRFEKLSDNPDTLQQLGYAAGATAPSGGSFNVSSAYTELRIPVLTNLPLVQDLVFSPSVRFDHYSNFGDATTYKLGGTWDVIPSFRIRASYSTGFRAPNSSELFGGNAISFISVAGDPCDSRAAGFNGNANAGTGSLAAGSTCFKSLTAIGLTPVQIANYHSAENDLSNDQRGLILGGNTALQPEKSVQYNIGTVFTPTFLPGFSANVDYYSVRVANSIISGGVAGNFGPDIVVNGCFGAAQNAAYCSIISRNASGIFQIGSQNTNFGKTQVKGLDAEVAYDTGKANLKLPFPGVVRVNFQMERQFQNNAQQPDGTIANYNGHFLYSNESVQPKWKGRANFDYQWGKVNFHYDAQYIGHAFDLGGTSTAAGDYLPDVFYHNISATFQLPEYAMMKQPALTVGINNLLDKDPPFLSGDSVCKCNSFAGPYDFDGRAFFARLSSKF